MNDVPKLRRLKLFDPPCCAPNDNLLFAGLFFKFLCEGEVPLKVPLKLLFGALRALVPGLGLHEILFGPAATFFFSN